MFEGDSIMKKLVAAFGIVVTLTVLGTVALGHFTEKKEGDEPYTPTKLEWLALRLNALRTTSDPQFTVNYWPLDQRNTIRLNVRHHKSMDPDLVKQKIDICRRFAYTIAGVYHWETWLQVKVETDTFGNE